MSDRVAPNPFRPSLCGQFIVSHHDGNVYDTVWTVEEAGDWLARLQVQGAHYEREADMHEREGQTIEAGISRSMAIADLTQAADLCDALISCVSPSITKAA